MENFSWPAVIAICTMVGGATVFLRIVIRDEVRKLSDDFVAEKVYRADARLIDERFGSINSRLSNLEPHRSGR